MKSSIVSVKIIPSVEIRVVHSYAGKDFPNNKRFKSALQAAKHWAFYVANDRTNKKNAAGAFASWEDRATYETNLCKKLTRRAKPVFERLLKSPA